MEPTDFSRAFNSASDRVLLETLDHPGDVHPMALEAARMELLRRNLSAGRMTEIRQAMNEKAAADLARKAKRNGAMERASKLVSELHGTIVAHPESSQDHTKRNWRVLLIVMGIMVLAVLPRIREVPRFLDHRMDASAMEYLFPLILLPCGLVLLWWRKRAGWFVGAFASAYYATEAIIGGCLFWKRHTEHASVEFDLFPETSSMTVILGVLYAFALTATFHRSRSMAVFSITEFERWAIRIAAAGLASIVWWWYLR